MTQLFLDHSISFHAIKRKCLNVRQGEFLCETCVNAQKVVYILNQGSSGGYKEEIAQTVTAVYNIHIHFETRTQVVGFPRGGVP